MYNTETFIKKAKLVHCNEFDYSLVEYKHSKEKIKIICKKHGIFKQQPVRHLMGQKCLKCVNEKQTHTKEIFINKANKIHNTLYDYSLVDYKNNEIKIKIICKIHGEFEQKPSNHLTGHGCFKCKNRKSRNLNYIKMCEEKFNNEYDYSLVKYKNNKTKVVIICKTHGKFKQTMKDHYKSNGCPYCSGKKMNTKLFIEKSTELHNNFFDYSLVKYNGAFKKVKIICKIHGLFEQQSSTHLNGSGCPICKSSKGEKNIILYLNKNNITYIHQKTFENCRYINVLPFDFYIPDYNMCIEYNGLQHYKPIEYFGGEEMLKYRKNNDKIKKNYCKSNNMTIKIITYRDNIIEKLTNIFNG